MAEMLPMLTAAEVISHLRPGNTVFVPGVSGESLPFYEALRRDPQRAGGLTFVGVHFPAVNRSDYLALNPTARQRAYFMSSSVRAGLRDARVDLMPMDYPGIVRDLEEGVAIDAALAQVSSPDERGDCSLGASYDFVPSVWKKARLRIAHVNPRLPRTRGSFRIRSEDCHLAFECAADIPTLATEAADEITRRHAAFVASLVRDGDTLQFGVGRLQGAVLGALSSHRRLRIHSGMVSPPVAGLIDAGAISGRAAVETGVALGDAAFYERIGADETFYFRPARETHDAGRIAAIPRFCAINSALSVDLFGQANAESIDGKLVAGAGGLPVFAAGGRLGRGGRSIVALSATAEGGKTSRITAAMNAGSMVTLPRHEADYVVTEYGVADLRGRSMHERALALIRIAAPEFQAALSARWHEMAAAL